MVGTAEFARPLGVRIGTQGRIATMLRTWLKNTWTAWGHWNNVVALLDLFGGWKALLLRLSWPW